MHRPHRSHSKNSRRHRLLARGNRCRRRERRINRTTLLERLEPRQLMAADLGAIVGPAFLSQPDPLPAANDVIFAQGADASRGVSRAQGDGCSTATCEETTVQVLVTTPTSGWQAQIEDIYRYADQLWVLSSLERPDPGRSVAQFFSQASDQVIVNSDELPAHHFVVSPTWDVSDDVVTRIFDAGEFYARFPRDQAELLFTTNRPPVVVKPLADVTVDEDAADVTVNLNGIFADPESGSDLSLAVSSDNQALVSTSLSGTELTLTFGADQFGSADVAVIARDSHGFEATEVFAVTVAPINDAPFVRQTPGEVVLTLDQPSRSLDLTHIFADIDNGSLAYRVVSHPSDLVAVSIDASTLSLRGVDDSVGGGNVVVEAKDAGGLSASVTIPVRSELAPLDLNKVHYALASDQIIQWRGANTFILAANLDSVHGVSVLSTNESVIAGEDVRLEAVSGGKLRVTIRHTSQQYGLTFLKFSAGGRTFGEVAALVLPNADVTLPDVGDPYFSVKQDVTADGTFVVEKTFNDGFVAKLVADGLLSATDAFRAVRAVSPTDAMVAHALQAGTQTQHIDPPSGTSRRVSTRAVLVNEAQVTSDTDFAFSNISYHSVDDPSAANAYDLSSLDSPFRLYTSVNHKAPYRSDAEYNAEFFGQDAAVAADATRLILDSSGSSMVAGSLAQVESETRQSLLDQLPEKLQQAAVETAGKQLAAQVLRWAGFGAGVIGFLPRLIFNFQPAGQSEVEWIAEKKRREALQKALDFEATVSARIIGHGNKIREATQAVDTGSLVGPANEYLQQAHQSVGEGLSTGHREIAEQLEKIERRESPFLDLQDGLADPPPRPAADVAEFHGENGDQEALLNQEVKTRVPSFDEVLDVSKKLFNIASTAQSIVGLVGDLFGETDRDGKEADYLDRDGKTYNLLEPQTRYGTSERDNINTGHKRDKVFAYAGNDRISTLDGDDEIHAGSGRNTVYGGAGDDQIFDGDGNSYLSAGEGDDAIHPGAGNDAIEGGTGVDTVVYDAADIGNDLIIDPSRAGTIRFDAYRIEEITLRKDRYDLEIILPGESDHTTNSVKLVGFFEQDAAGWRLVDSLANEYDLYALTGRVTSFEALQIAFQERPADNTPSYPGHIVPQTVLTDPSGRFTVHVAEDRRLIGVNSTLTRPGLVLTFEGDTGLDGWLTRNEFASLAEANELMSTIRATVDVSQYDRVTLIGVGEGGLVAQWFGAFAASNGPSFVTSQLINSPDISGLISQVVREQFPEYQKGFPALHTNYLVHAGDWVSGIGLWAGPDETYATWKAWDFDHAPDAGVPILPAFRDLQRAHAPTPSSLDFDSLTIDDLDHAHVRGIVSFQDVDSLANRHANRKTMIGGEMLDSTVNPRQIFILPGATDPQSDFIAETQEIRDAFTALLDPDPQAADPDRPFHLKLDLQASEQQGEHLAPEHQEATEDTLFVVQGTYGWESLGGVKAGADRGRATGLERDSVKVKKGQFLVDLTQPGAGAGTYNVTITLGDRQEIQESMHILINGYQSDRVSTMPGDFLTRTFQVNTLDDRLRISFLDTGGEHEYTSINGISVEKVNYRTDLTVSEQLDDDPSIVVMTPSYQLPETSAGIEIYKEAIIAAATSALTAGAGSVLGATGIGSSIAALGGNLGAGASATIAAQGSIVAGIKASVGKAALHGVIGSLATTIPQHFSLVGKARDVLKGAKSVFSTLEDAGKHVQSAQSAFAGGDLLGGALNGLRAIEDGLSATKKGVETVNAALANPAAPPTVPMWVYDVSSSLQQMSQKFRLGKLNTAFVPVDLDEIDQAIRDGKSPRQILKRWQGSRDFLVLDWVPTKETLTEVSVSDHRDLVHRGARAVKQLVEAYLEELQAGDPQAELDLLLISHGAGYDINREAVTRLNTGDSVDSLDYVKLVTLDPYSANRKSFTWYHPEMTNVVDRVDNYYQTEEVDSSLWLAALSSPIVLVGSDPGGSDLYHGGSDSAVGALDGRIGGGSAGFYNRQARIFDLASTEELLRFRHWDPNEINLSTAELTDIEFSPDGSLVAASGKDGIVTVRYVDDVLDPDSDSNELLHAAGEVKFVVWGQESIVRSLAFMELEVPAADGSGTVWKDFLLTISAARNPANGDIDKNKVLLTDVETGLPVWQGRDIKGTQVEASPSGNVIVSTDANGRAKIWKRVRQTVTYEKHGDIVDAHPAQDGSYIADLLVINDDYFVTAGLDRRMKLFRVTDDGAVQVQGELFDDPGEGKVRNLDYDPYNGVLAVGSGQVLSLWKFDQQLGTLSPLAPAGQAAGTTFTRHDHIDTIQGISFSKPSFLLDQDGNYAGDRTFAAADGQPIPVPRTPAGDIDIRQLSQLLEDHDRPSSLAGLKLLTGGEDKTLFLYSLDRLDIGDLREESVLSGSMLPIRELTLSADGRRVALVGQDNVDDNTGGPVKDHDVTGELDDRLGWRFSELFLQGRREHNAVPQQYIYDTVEQQGESYFWMRNSRNANRPGSLDKDRNLALPPNKRDNKEGVDVAPIDLYLRPGQKVDIKPLHYLLEVNRSDYTVDQDSLQLGPVVDEDGTVIGTIKHKVVDGKTRPNVLVFIASDHTVLDYSDLDRRQFTGSFQLTMTGPDDLAGNPRTIEDATIRFRIINHKPTTYRDIVELHPNRQEVDFRPRANDYDFDNDDFALYQFAPQSLYYQAGTAEQELLATVKPNKDSKHGVDIDVVVDEDRLGQLLEELAQQTPAGQVAPAFIPLEFTYQVREEKYRAISTGTVEVRLQLQAAPENVRYAELGADQVLIAWDPVSWSADKYAVQRFDTASQTWVKHAPDSDIQGRKSDALRVKGLAPQTEYWFRVVAINTNSERRHPDDPNAPKETGLRVVTPAYVGPDLVRMEAYGASQVEVRWSNVHWDVKKYQIELRQLIVDADGKLAIENGEYQYVADATRTKEVLKGDGLSVVFKKLESGTPYLAIVTAKNFSKGVAESTVAETPATTAERDLPAGIDMERIGPKKIRVSWATVSYAQAYRVVAIDPTAPLDDARRIEAVFTAENGKNRNSGILTGLPKPDPSAEDEWVLIVEAKDKHGHWVSVVSTDVPPTELRNATDGSGENRIDISENGSNDYLLAASLTDPVRLPSLDGLFVGTEFSVVNFSRQPVAIKAFDVDQRISLLGASSATHTLQPAVGTDDGVNRIVVYRFVVERVGSGTESRAVWKAVTSDNTSEARVVKTPPYLAAEAGTLEKDIENSRPKQLRVTWESPFWNVTKHRIEIYKAVVDANGAPQPDPQAPGTFFKDNRPAAPGKTKLLAEANDRFFAHKFEGLQQGTAYIVVLTSTGPAGTWTEEYATGTELQRSPSGIEARSITLDSFTAAWTREAWAVASYRVNLVELDAQGRPMEATRQYRGAQEDKSSKLIDQLESGATYQFTVEARNRDGEWLENTAENTKQVTILSPDDLGIAGLTLDAARNRQLDFTWQPLDFTPLSLFFEITPAGANAWQRPDEGGVQIDKTSKTLVALQLNTAYEARLVATVEDSAGAVHRVVSREVAAATEWQIEAADNATASTVRVGFPRVASATKYDVVVYLPSGTTDVQKKTIDQGEADPRYTTISDLTPLTDYEVEVVARDGSTVLGRTDRQTFKTAAAAAVTGLTTTEVRKQTIDLKWNAMSWTPASQFIEIKVAGTNNWYRPTGSGVLIGKTTNTISELVPGTTYQIRHVATLDLADGSEYRAVSGEITRTTETYSFAAPTVDQITPTTARANWKQLGEGGVTDYRLIVYLANTNTEATRKTVGVGSGARSSTITGLTQKTSYQLVVEALKGSRILATSARVSFTTAEQISYVAPSITAFTNVRSKAAVVNWSFAGKLSDLEKFSIRRNDSGKTWLASYTPSGSSPFSYEIKRNADTKWWIIVRAHYRDGTTRDSEPKQLPKSGNANFAMSGGPFLVRPTIAGDVGGASEPGPAAGPRTKPANTTLNDLPRASQEVARATPRLVLTPSVPSSDWDDSLAGALVTSGTLATPSLHEAIDTIARDQSPPDYIAARLVAVNGAGEEVVEVDSGTEFAVQLRVRDLRENPQGVFSSYVDLMYDANLVTATQIEHGQAFTFGLSGDLSSAGLLNDAGGISGFGFEASTTSPITGAGGREQIVFAVAFLAGQAGTAEFTLDAERLANEHHFLLLGRDEPVDTDHIALSGLSLEIIAPLACPPYRNCLLPEDVNGDGWVSPNDALQVINDLNALGARVLTGPGGPPYVDVNADGLASALDALRVINYLNRGGNAEADGDTMIQSLSAAAFVGSVRQPADARETSPASVRSSTGAQPPAVGPIRNGHVPAAHRPSIPTPLPLGPRRSAPHATTPSLDATVRSSRDQAFIDLFGEPL